MKKLGIGLGALLLIFFILCFVLPRDFRLEREITIAKPLNEVFMKVLFLKNHEQWSYYSLKDPNIQKNYFGQDGTEGFRSAWTSENEEVGTGEQEIKRIRNNEFVNTEIRLEKPFKGTFESNFKTVLVGENQTKVVMEMHSKIPIPLNVISYIYNVCLGNQQKIARNMDESLANMKEILEK